jgi:hypothetical protein
MTLDKPKLGIMALGIVALVMMTLGIIAFRITRHYDF